MKENARSPSEAERTKTCPNCKGIAVLIVPLKSVSVEGAVYGCKTCGLTFDNSGRAIIQDTKDLQNVFRGATLGNKTLVEMFGGTGLTPAMRAAMQAQLLEYGVQMWFDGLKQGLLLGATSDEYRHNNSTTPNTEGS